MRIGRVWRSPGLLPLLILWVVLAPCPCAAAAGPGNARYVVVLYPENNDGSPGQLLVDQSIRSTFATGSPEPVEVHNEYLDVSPARDAGFRQLQVEYLRRKYAGRKVDLVIVGLSSALDYALEHRQQLFPGVPIVLCAVDQREVQSRKLPPDVVGVPVAMDLAATLDLALRLHPNTRHVFVVAGGSKFDAYWEAEARQTFRASAGKLEFVYLTGLPMDELVRRVANLPEHSIVYYLHVFQDGVGKTFVPADALEALAAKANAPIYGHVDTYVGRGVVGGRVFSFETAGKDAARLGLRLFAGERPEAIGTQELSENAYLFDGRQLRRWNVSEDSLPAGSVVRFKGSSFWDLYHWHVIGVISFCIVEALLIVGLLVQRANRMRADRRFRQVIEAAPTGMLMVGHDGTIVLANAQMEKLFGYRKEEMLCQPVDMLLPERIRKRLAIQRDHFFASPRVRTLGAGQELFGRCKDGHEFPVEIGLSPVRIDARAFVLASVIDVTERKRAEAALQASERRYRTLFEKANDAIFLETEDDEIVAANVRACDLLGYSLEELLAKRVPDLQAPEVRGRPGAIIKAELAQHQGRTFESLDVHRDGRRIPVEVTDAVFEEDGQRLVLSIVRDVTERKQAEGRLRQSHRELQKLTGRLLQAQETERRRIARELHDDLSQSLALLSVDLDLAGQSLPESAAPFAGRLRELSIRVKQLSSSVHDLSHQLHPARLEQLGLVVAVRGLCNELTQGHGLSIEFTDHQVPAAIPENIALSVYRIAQEALRNAATHSRAGHAEVALSGSTDAIRLLVVDDGIGFDPHSVTGQGRLGLVSMAERVRLVGGTIVIDSRPAGGTRIDVRVALCSTGEGEGTVRAGSARTNGESMEGSVARRLL